MAALLICGIAGSAAQQDRIRGPIDANESVVLRGNVHPRARPENDRGPLDPSTAIHGVKLVLAQTVRQARDLERLLEAQRDPGSPDYRRWLTPEEFGERFGVGENDLARLASWLESRGFVIERVARARNWIAFNGTMAQIAAAFHTELHRYEAAGEIHFANVAAPSIPAAIAGVVDAIRGLDDFRPLPQNSRGAVHPDFNAGGGNHYLAPGDLATIYDIQPLYAAGYDGSGQKLAVAGQTDINLADIRSFRAQFHLPAKDPQLVLAGTDPGVNSGDQIEADLDLEWAGATAPNATILYVYSRNVFESVQYAIDQSLAPVISVSYGGCELWGPPSYLAMAQQANAQGITWINASGDAGAAGCDGGDRIAGSPPSVTFPANIPQITAVGGTEFDESGGSYWADRNGATSASALSWIPERAWNDTSPGHGLAASGGGASAVYGKPWWQAGPGVPDDHVRDVPDVALAASGAHDAYLIYAGGLLSMGGTSAAAPSFAGIVAILNQYLLAKHQISQPGLGNLNPSLYRLARDTTGLFHDITAGDNMVPCAPGVSGCVAGSYGYRAGPGYDLATGLGSVDAWNLVTKWNSLPPVVGTSLALSAGPAAIAQTQSFQLTATASAVTGANPPTGIVDFTLESAPLGSAALTGSGTNSAATVVVQGSLLAAGANTITATYFSSGSFSGSTAATVVTVTAPPIATSTTLAANPADIARTGSTMLTATVKPASGLAAPSGSVSFAAGATPLGNAVLAPLPQGSTATLIVQGSSLAGGAAVVASYAGGGGFGASTSPPLTVRVSGAPVATAMTLAASPTALPQNASTSLTATVKPVSGTISPTGSVAFTAGATALGSAVLSISNGASTATLTVNGAVFASGNNVVAAAYSGNSTFAGSSATVNITVTAPPTATATTLTLVAAPAGIAPSASTLLSATVKSVTGNAGPGGNIAFAIAGASLGSVPVVVSGTSGTATLTVKGASLAGGSNNITATYTPAGNFTGAVSSVTVTVVSPPAVASMTVTASPASIVQTAATQLMAIVQLPAGTNPRIASVTFAAGKTTLGAVALAISGTTGTARLMVRGTSLAPGNNTITAICVGTGLPAVTATAVVNVVAAATASR